MSQAISALWRNFWLLISFLIMIFAIAWSGNGAVRILFILGCVVVSIHAKHNAAVHFQSVIVLFCLAPFLRRIIDLTSAYEPTGLMLIGPFLALLVPAIDLYNRRQQSDPALKPLIVVGTCAAYAALISEFGGEIMTAASGVLKWLTPLVYGAWLYRRALEDDGLVIAATQALMTTMPVLSVYGIVQYVDPPIWDQAWMINVKMLSIGLPEPYSVRVFSTMNSPASFATYTVCAMLLIGVRGSWLSVVVSYPCMLGLLLSLYRTAWTGLVLGMMVCILVSATRRRGVLLALSGLSAALLVLTITSFAANILNRLDTFSQGVGDGSAHDRLDEYTAMFNDSIFGNGFSSDNGSSPAWLDGQIVFCIYAMGLVMGTICIVAIIWGGCKAIACTISSQDRGQVALSAVIASMLIQLPLANIASGEIGVLFWSFVGIASAAPRRVVVIRRPA